MNQHLHWETVYQRKAPENVSWFRPHLEQSLAFVQSAALTLDAPIIDVGGGASTFVDDLLARGFTNLTVLDISATALESAKTRLGAQASKVTWLIADITQAQLPAHHFAFWHDRAVFHFLSAREQRQSYVQAAHQALRPGAPIVVGTFGLEGPEQCSGLGVTRYSADGIHAEFGTAFEKIDSVTETHVTPWGSPQQFVYCLCKTR